MLAAVVRRINLGSGGQALVSGTFSLVTPLPKNRFIISKVGTPEQRKSNCQPCDSLFITSRQNKVTLNLISQPCQQ
jgi:hypothetical protein